MELDRSVLEREQSSPVDVRGKKQKDGDVRNRHSHSMGKEKSLQEIYSWCPTMVSFVTDADHATCAVPMATAEPWTHLANVHMVNPPAVPLSCTLLLNPAELSSPEARNTFQNAYSAAT